MQVADRAAESTNIVTHCRAAYDCASASSSRIFLAKHKYTIRKYQKTQRRPARSGTRQSFERKRSSPIKGRQILVMKSCILEKSVCSPTTSAYDTFRSSAAATTSLAL